jgi:hypothetical protein
MAERIRRCTSALDTTARRAARRGSGDCCPRRSDCLTGTSASCFPGLCLSRCSRYARRRPSAISATPDAAAAMPSIGGKETCFCVSVSTSIGPMSTAFFLSVYGIAGHARTASPTSNKTMPRANKPLIDVPPRGEAPRRALVTSTFRTLSSAPRPTRRARAKLISMGIR